MVIHRTRLQASRSTKSRAAKNLSKRGDKLDNVVVDGVDTAFGVPLQEATRPLRYEGEGAGLMSWRPAATATTNVGAVSPTYLFCDTHKPLITTPTPRQEVS
jgi:hypothetical protein